MRLRDVFITAFLLFPLVTRAQLMINEILATNATTLIETDFYNFPDYIELYNSGNSAVNLSDYYLSDENDNLLKWNCPSVTLAAKQFYIVYCDKNNTGRHASFGLSADGEAVYLTHKNGSSVDFMTYRKQYPDISYGRDPADMMQWLYCSVPTPGYANNITTATSLSEKAGYSIDAGRLNASASLSLSGNYIKYTINGAEPGSSSPSCSQPISVNKTMTVKSKIFEPGFLPGETYANTYFINEHPFSLPVVALSFTPDYFYDDIIGLSLIQI